MHPSFRLSFVAALVLAACSSNTPDPSPTSPSATKPLAPSLPKDLKAGMKAIEEPWKVLEEGQKQSEGLDLAAMATAADACAFAMHLAYDPYEDKEVPNFAQFAREAEAALQKMAAAARAGRAAAVRELGKSLQEQHCARCHDAVEEARG
jgi:hypothetical protein